MISLRNAIRKLFFLLILLWFGGFEVKGQDYKSTDEIIAKVDSLIPALQTKFKVPGVSYCIIRDFELVYSRSFGVKDVRTQEPVTDETMFEACSMSKPVFAYIAMKQIENGSLDLDTPVWTIYDDPAFQGQELRKKITARMLLSHTSGLPNWRPGDDEENGYLPIEFEPGTKFSYSGEGMYYLQKVVEKITGKSLEILAKETLFERNFMRNSSFNYSPEIEKNLASGHDTSGNFNKKTAYSRANAGYSLYCSAIDYALFLLDIMAVDRPGGDALSSETIDIMLTPQIKAATREPQQRPGNSNGIECYRGLGWVIDSTLAGDICYHSGANGSGFKCYSQFNRKTGSGIVIMTNGSGGLGVWDTVIRKVGDL
jgi:CubicO group peptidase (beta-lactamase class C family)